VDGSCASGAASKVLHWEPLAMSMPLLPTRRCSLLLLLVTTCGPTRAHADAVGNGTAVAARVAATAMIRASAEAAKTLARDIGDPIQVARTVMPQEGLDSMGSTPTAAAAKVPSPILRGAIGSTSFSVAGDADIPMLVKAGMWMDVSHTPSWLTGHCRTVWSSSVAKYRLPYRVEFGKTSPYHRWGHFTGEGWRKEYGIGTFMSPPRTTIFLDGGWETSYFAASRFTPDATNSTNCCCEYVTQSPGRWRVLSDYCATAVPHTAHLPLKEVCAPHVQRCPLNRTFALAEMGPPFVEVYSPCTPIAEPATSSGSLKGMLQFCLVLLVALLATRQICCMLLYAVQAWILAKRSLNEPLL